MEVHDRGMPADQSRIAQAAPICRAAMYTKKPGRTFNFYASILIEATYRRFRSAYGRPSLANVQDCLWAQFS